MNASQQRGHTQIQQARFDLESIVRKIMLRRLLTRRSVSSKQDEEKDAPTTNVKNSTMNENDNSLLEKTLIKNDEIFDKVNNKDEDLANNKLVIETVARKEQFVNSTFVENVDVNEVEEVGENCGDLSSDEESEAEIKKKDEEKESAKDGDTSTELLPESEPESNTESCQSEVCSDAEGKDSGIDKGESPTFSCKELSDEEVESKMAEENDKNTCIPLPTLNKLNLPCTTTLQVLSPANNTKAKRFVRRSKSERRSTTKNLDFDPSELSGESSPEKIPRERKNRTVSYLSYPQRFVRSSLAVEARLSQWRKETSVLEGRGSPRVETPAARAGILKQTAENTMRNSMIQQHGAFKAARKGRINFDDSRLSDSDSSSDEDVKRMSVRKLYNSKNALRKRIDNLEGMLLSMATQKKGLEDIIATMQTWSLELSEVERTKLGVPYIRSVKQVLRKQRQCLNSKKSDFGRIVTLLGEAKVPCFDDVTKMIQQLNKDISNIVQDRKRYSSRHVEDIRLGQGKIIGTCSAINDVFYEE